MTPTDPEAHVAHSTRFTVHLPDGSVLHGVEFPSGRIVADDPISGLMVAASMEDLIGPLDVARVERVADDVANPAAARPRDMAEVPDAELVPEYREHLDRRPSPSPCDPEHQCCNPTP